MKRTVLVPVGTGVTGARLLDEAVAEARWRRASILLLHVLDLPGELPPETYLLSEVQVADALEQAARAPVRSETTG